MTVDKCTQSDFHEILTDLSDFWGSDRTLSVHHPMFIHEFGDTAFVIKGNGKIIAYLFGFLSQTQKTGYIHANPVRAGLIDHPAKWQWSSYHAHFPHETGEVAIEIDQRPYWTDEELRTVGEPPLGVGR